MADGHPVPDDPDEAPAAEPTDEGGDPPCWADLIEDHRDRPGAVRPAPGGLDTEDA